MTKNVLRGKIIAVSQSAEPTCIDASGEKPRITPREHEVSEVRERRVEFHLGESKKVETEHDIHGNNMEQTYPCPRHNQ